VADFKVIRGSTILAAGQASLTLTNGVDYTLESGIAADAWFFQISSNHFSGMGKTALGGSQNFDDVTAYPSVSGDNVTLHRPGTANNNRVDWQIVQYIGAAGGANEIKVRQAGVETPGTGDLTATTAIPGTVADSAALVPLICGQATSYTARAQSNHSLFTAEIVGSDVVWTRGRTGQNGFLSYALVEFTGNNWTITREQYQNPAGTNAQNVTLTTALTDYEKTFIHAQQTYTTTATTGLDDSSYRVRLINNTTLEHWDTTATDDSIKRNVIWLVQNPDMAVARYAGTMAGTGEEEIYNVPITAVDDVDQVLLTGCTNDSTGTGTAFPRGYINYYLSAADNVLLRQSDNGQASDYAFEVVRLPESTGGEAYEGSFSLAGASANQASGGKQARSSASLAAASAVSATAQASESASGSFTLSASASIGSSGHKSTTTAASLIASAATTWSGSAGESASGSFTISASSAIGSSGQKSTTIAASLIASAAITWSGSAGETTVGSFALVQTAGLSAGAHKSSGAGVALSALANVSTSGLAAIDSSGSFTLASVSDLVTAGQRAAFTGLEIHAPPALQIIAAQSGELFIRLSAVSVLAGVRLTAHQPQSAFSAHQARANFIKIGD